MGRWLDDFNDKVASYLSITHKLEKVEALRHEPRRACVPLASRSRAAEEFYSLSSFPSADGARRDVHRLDLLEQRHDLVDIGDVALLPSRSSASCIRGPGRRCRCWRRVPGAAIDRLHHAVRHRPIGAVRRHQRQHDVDAPLKRQKRLPGSAFHSRLRPRRVLHHGVHHHLELGDVLLLRSGRPCRRSSRTIVDEIVEHLELGLQRADAEEIVVGIVALAVEHGVGGADHLLAHVLVRALAVERVGDEREIERALAHAEPVGEQAQAVALDGERLEAPGLLVGGASRLARTM